MKFSGTLAFENDGGEDFPEKSREVEVLVHQAPVADPSGSGG